MPQIITVRPGRFYSADGVAMPIWIKDPHDVVDYTLDWTRLLNDDDAVVAVTYIVAPASQLKVLSTNFTTTQTTCWLMGGVTGETYSVTAQITTRDGRQEERTFQIVIGLN